MYPYRVKHDMVIVHCSFNVASDASAAFDTFYQTNRIASLQRIKVLADILFNI